jgi:large subunit ribosomal protein L21
MYAIVQSGSKQFFVRKGDLIHVDLLDAQIGQEVELKDVLLVVNEEGTIQLGKPTLSGCVVKAHYMAEVKGPKINGLKYKQRKNTYRSWGHRQRYAQLKILDICQ